MTEIAEFIEILLGDAGKLAPWQRQALDAIPQDTLALLSMSRRDRHPIVYPPVVPAMIPPTINAQYGKMGRMDPWAVRRNRRAMIEHYQIKDSAHTPKPEKMFEVLIRNGVMRIERRRFKPPRIIWL